MSTNVTQSIEHLNRRRWPGRAADTIGAAVDQFLGRRGREKSYTGPLPPNIVRGETREGGRAIRL